MNIQEDYVSFEIAKLLKEKGFSGECFSMYVTPKPYSGMGNPNKAKIAPHGRDSHYYEGYEYQCEAPTLQMACKWLREVHKLGIFPSTYTNIMGSNTTHVYGTAIVNLNTYELMTSDYMARDTYNEACEEAIKYCLENLI